MRGSNDARSNPDSGRQGGYDNRGGNNQGNQGGGGWGGKLFLY